MKPIQMACALLASSAAANYLLRGHHTLEVHDPPVKTNPILIAQNETLAKLEVRLTNITESVQKAQLKLDTLSHNLAEVEGVAGQSRINLADSINVLKEVKEAAKVNKDKSEALDKSSVEISARVKNETDSFQKLATRLTGLEESSKILNSDASEVGKKVSKLEKSVLETMPGGDVSERLDALNKKITLFVENLKKGITEEVKKDLEDGVTRVRNEVESVGQKMEKGKWLPTPLDDYAKKESPPSVLNEAENKKNDDF